MLWHLAGGGSRGQSALADERLSASDRVRFRLKPRTRVRLVLWQVEKLPQFWQNCPFDPNVEFPIFVYVEPSEPTAVLPNLE